MLLSQMSLDAWDLDLLALQLTAALDRPLVLYLSSADLGDSGSRLADRIGRSWEDLVRRVCRAE
jgi:polyketide synthase 12